MGEQFATIERKLNLATLARRYHLGLVFDTDVNPLVSITTLSLGPLETRIKPKIDSQ